MAEDQRSSQRWHCDQLYLDDVNTSLSQSITSNISQSHPTANPIVYPALPDRKYPNWPLQKNCWFRSFIIQRNDLQKEFPIWFHFWGSASTSVLPRVPCTCCLATARSDEISSEVLILNFADRLMVDLFIFFYNFLINRTTRFQEKSFSRRTNWLSTQYSMWTGQRGRKNFHYSGSSPGTSRYFIWFF